MLLRFITGPAGSLRSTSIRTQHGATAKGVTMDKQVSDPSQSTETSRRVAYIVLRFPTLSETFIVREIHALRDRGWQIDIYPLWRDNPEQVHPDVPPLCRRCPAQNRFRADPAPGRGLD